MYQSEFCDVSYLSDINVVFVKWKKFCKGKDYRDPLLYAIDIMKTHEGCHYVADTCDGFENEEADTLWVFNEFIPLAASAGCQYIFFIILPDNKLKEELEGQSVELKKFFQVVACFNLDEVKQVLEKSTNKKYLLNDFDSTKTFKVMDEIPIWSAPFGLKLLDAVCYKKDMTVLDIGFYTGFPLTELAMRLGESSTIYGIDPWQEAIERAKEKVEAYGIRNIKIIQGVAESIPLSDSSVDLITSNNGINNVEDIEKVFTECSRVIKSGGQLVQTMNLSQSMFEFYDLLESVLLEMGMRKEVELIHLHIEEKRPSVSKIKTLAQKHGFVIKDVEYDQFNYKFADGTSMLNYHFIRLAFMNSWIGLLPPQQVEEIFTRIESTFNKYAEQNNGVKLSIPFALINATKK